MSIPKQIADQFRKVHFGGNWTGSCLKEQLTNLTWEQATTKVYSFNTIATLAFHVNYYVEAALMVLKNQPLNAKDEFSFAHPPFKSQGDWDNFLEKIWSDAEELAVLIENFPESRLEDIFVKEKYGTYYRNFTGVIEHMHYHLGQIALIRKMIEQESHL